MKDNHNISLIENPKTYLKFGFFLHCGLWTSGMVWSELTGGGRANFTRWTLRFVSSHLWRTGRVIYLCILSAATVLLRVGCGRAFRRLPSCLFSPIMFVVRVCIVLSFALLRVRHRVWLSTVAARIVMMSGSTFIVAFGLLDVSGGLLVARTRSWRRA
jgi:hypothetical protein